MGNKNKSVSFNVDEIEFAEINEKIKELNIKRAPYVYNIYRTGLNNNDLQKRVTDLTIQNERIMKKLIEVCNLVKYHIACEGFYTSKDPKDSEILKEFYKRRDKIDD